MPDLVTHTYFAEMIMTHLTENMKRHITNKDLFLFAAAGPDPFFFYRFLNKSKNKEIREFGNLMHTEKTGYFLINLIHEINNNEVKFKDIKMDVTLSEYKDELFSYLCGFISHFALDSKVHPYIFHKTGQYDNQNESTLIFRGSHTKLERAIDCKIIRSYYKENPNRFQIAKKILTLKKLPENIWNPLNKVYEKTYSLKEMAPVINQSIKDQRKFYRFIYDPIGIKRRLFRLLDNNKGAIDYKVLSYYGSEINHLDIMNKKQARWTFPNDKNLVSFESVYELIEKAKENCIFMIKVAYEVIYQNKTHTLVDVFQNISYLTGTLLSTNQEMKYFHHIFLKKNI